MIGANCHVDLIDLTGHSRVDSASRTNTQTRDMTHFRCPALTVFLPLPPLLPALMLLLPPRLHPSNTTILHDAFISMFIALWAILTHYVTILMPILSYFTRFT